MFDSLVFAVELYFSVDKIFVDNVFKSLGDQYRIASEFVAVFPSMLLEKPNAAFHLFLYFVWLYVRGLKLHREEKIITVFFRYY